MSPRQCIQALLLKPKEFKKRVTEILQGQKGDPAQTHIKAVDSETGKLSSWTSWNTPTDAQIQERDEKATVKKTEPEKEKLVKGGFDFPPSLPLFVQADTNRWLEKLTRGKRHMQCKAPFTDPSSQGQGMGSALVGYGNHLADEAGLPIFLQASPYRYPVDEKHGFETVQYLDVDAGCGEQ